MALKVRMRLRRLNQRRKKKMRKKRKTRMKIKMKMWMARRVKKPTPPVSSNPSITKNNKNNANKAAGGSVNTDTADEDGNISISGDLHKFPVG